MASLGNNTVEVVDLRQGKVASSIGGLAEPQGIVFLPEFNRIYVANGGDGSLRAFDGANYAPLTSLALGDDADNVRYDAATRQLLVAYGGGGLAFVDAASGRKAGDVTFSAHPESFQLETSGARIFVNVPGSHEVAVVDRRQRKVIAHWSTGLVSANFPMALDEPHHRLFIGCRVPARLLALNTESGQVVAQLNLDGDCDDLFFDAPSRRILASCGRGFVDVFNQADADHYALGERVATAAGARTCALDDRYLYLAVPSRGDQPAAIRCYRLNP